MSGVLVELQKPIWNGGKPHIGVADFRLNNGATEVHVKIAYTRKDGTKSFPGVYKMPVKDLIKYPVQVVGGGVRLYVAPLKDWSNEPE